MQVEEAFEDGLKEEVWRVWPPKKIRKGIEEMAEEVGVEVRLGEEYGWREWYEGFEEAGDYEWMMENGVNVW